MIIRMMPSASDGDVEYVMGRARSLGLQAYLSRPEGHTVVALMGNTKAIEPSAFTGLPGVERVLHTEKSYRLASRDFSPADSRVEAGRLVIGGRKIVLMAGPCAVESRSQLLETAARVSEYGGHVIRGGAFKPRTSPYSFQGLEREGLEILAEARAQTGLPIVTEVLTAESVEMVAEYADILQVGTRNMQNFPLLNECGESGKPVLLMVS